MKNVFRPTRLLVLIVALATTAMVACDFDQRFIDRVVDESEGRTVEENRRVAQDLMGSLREKIRERNPGRGKDFAIEIQVIAAYMESEQQGTELEISTDDEAVERIRQETDDRSEEESYDVSRSLLGSLSEAMEAREYTTAQDHAFELRWIMQRLE